MDPWKSESPTKIILPVFRQIPPGLWPGVWITCQLDCIPYSNDIAIFNK
jgi:hypothetical protein